MATTSLNLTVDGLAVQLPARIADYRCTYPGQDSPQPAFLQLRMDEPPHLCATFNGEVGSNAVPGDVYTGRTLRFGFPCDARLKTVREAIRKVAPMCAELVKSYGTEWNGQNMAGVFDHALRDKIQETLDDEFGVERW